MSHIVAILPMLVVVAFQDRPNPTPADRQSSKPPKSRPVQTPRN